MLTKRHDNHSNPNRQTVKGTFPFKNAIFIVLCNDETDFWTKKK